MIDDLDKSLEELLKQEMPKTLKDQVTVSFAVPDDQFPPQSVTLPAIDLFLYDIRENMELRSNQWAVEKYNGRAIERPPPVRVDCSYLVTAWASQSSTTPAFDEHHMLAEVMKVMLRHPTLPPDVLKGSLKDQEPDLPAIVLQTSHLQSMGEFWQALGGKPKAALNYSVTISVEPFKAIESPVVLEKIIEIKHGSRIKP